MCGGIREGSHHLMANQAGWKAKRLTNNQTANATHKLGDASRYKKTDSKEDRRRFCKHASTTCMFAFFHNLKIDTHSRHSRAILKAERGVHPQSKPLFYRIISRKSAGPRKCLFNKTVSCRRE